MTEATTLLERLDAAGRVGLDMSPGDPLAREAKAEIERLQASERSLREDNRDLSDRVNRLAADTEHMRIKIANTKEAVGQAIEIIGVNLYHQREKVEDAAAILRAIWNSPASFSARLAMTNDNAPDPDVTIPTSEYNRLLAATAKAGKLEARVKELEAAARKSHDTLIELNPINYSHDDVCEANSAAVEAILLLADLLGETHGKTPEWWAERRRALLNSPARPKERTDA